MNIWKRLAFILALAISGLSVSSVNWVQPVVAQSEPTSVQGCYGDVTVAVVKPHKIYLEVGEAASYTADVTSYPYDGTPRVYYWKINGEVLPESAMWTLNFVSMKPGDFTLEPVVGDGVTNCTYNGKVIVTVTDPSAPEAVDLAIDFQFQSEDPEVSYVNELLTTIVTLTNKSDVTATVFANLVFHNVTEQGGDMGEGYEYTLKPGTDIIESYEFTLTMEGTFSVTAEIQQIGNEVDLNPSDNTREKELNVAEPTQIPVDPTVVLTYMKPVFIGITETFTVETSYIPEEANTQISFFCESDIDPEHVVQVDTPMGSSSVIIEFAPAKECMYTAYVRTYADDNNAIIALEDVDFQVTDPLGPGPDGAYWYLPAIYR